MVTEHYNPGLHGRKFAKKLRMGKIESKIFESMDDKNKKIHFVHGACITILSAQVNCYGNKTAAIFYLILSRSLSQVDR